MASAREVRLSCSVENRKKSGTRARVEAETRKFARSRGSSRALGTRGLCVLWNYYAANSHAATPVSTGGSVGRGEPGRFSVGVGTQLGRTVDRMQ